MIENTCETGYVQKLVEELYIESGGHSADKGQVISLLSPGIFIKTQVSNSFRWNVNTILKIKGDLLTLPFTMDDALSAILIDDVVKFRVGVEKFDINFLCTIRSIDLNASPTKLIKVLKVEIWKNKRGSTRHNAGYLCKSESEIQENFMSYLVNISDSGGGVICKENLRIGSNVKLSFFGPDGTPLDLIATIVRSKKIFESKIEYGIRFFNMRPEVYQKIEGIIGIEKLQESGVYHKICKDYKINPLT